MLFRIGEVNVRCLHADKAGLPGRKTEANNREEDKGVQPTCAAMPEK